MGSSGVYLRRGTKAARQLLNEVSVRRRMEEDLFSTAGLADRPTTDPLQQMTMHFQDVFDRRGRSAAERRAGESDSQNLFDAKALTSGMTGRRDPVPGAPEKLAHPAVDGYGAEHGGRGLRQTGRPAGTENDMTRDGAFFRNFAETAFERGTLSSGILGGTGKAMLVSCLRRTMVKAGFRQKPFGRMFSQAPAQMAVRNTKASVVFGRYAGSAAGLVVDALQDARRTLQVFERLAEGDATQTPPGWDPEALFRLYPFLSERQDDDNILTYRNWLGQMERNDLRPGLASRGGTQWRDVHAGLDRAQTMRVRKRQMRESFLLKLQELREKAQEAEEEYTASDFPGWLAEQLEETLEPPPDDGDDEDGNNRGTDGTGDVGGSNRVKDGQANEGGNRGKD